MKNANVIQKAFECFVNNDHEKAQAMLHEYFVTEARNMLRETAGEDEAELEFGGDYDSQLKDEVTDDLDTSADELDAEMNGMTEEEEFGESEPDLEGIEDRLMDVESQLEELQAEYDELVAQESSEEEHAD